MPYFIGLEYHIWADGIAFAFALAAIILCFVQIHHHIYHNHHPETRKYIIRILLMVVVYCIESWFGLYVPSLSLYLDTIRDFYEAIVIYSFYQLLICALGGYENVQHAFFCIPMNTFPHVFPFSLCCKPWPFATTRVSNSFLKNTTIGVLQYCFVQALCVISTFIMQLFDVYNEGSFNYNAGYPYIIFIRSVSQTWAIYCLVLFYLALKKQPLDSEGYQLFSQIRPIPKFLCIKGVVFFTYWQSVIIAFFVYFNVIQPTDTWTSTNIATALQDLIICIEMLFASVAHIYAFKVNDFKESGYTPLVAPHKVMFDVANVTDLMSDARDVLSTKNYGRMSDSQNDEYFYEDEDQYSDDETDNYSNNRMSFQGNCSVSSNSNNDCSGSSTTEDERRKKKKKRKRNRSYRKNRNPFTLQSALESHLSDDIAL